MYYTGLDPRTMKPVTSAHDPHEKAMQRALLQYRKPENYDLVKEALLRAHREDLIGFGENCLIPPRKMGGQKQNGSRKNDQAPTDKGANQKHRKSKVFRNAGHKSSRNRGKKPTRYR